MSGALVLVVGPSGVGKDTLLNGVRALYREDSRFHFLKREITRPEDAGGEDHTSVSAAQFEAHRDAGAYALNWGAHGLFYGLPKSELTGLERGVVIVANGSRSVLDEARIRFDRLAIISINAPETILRARLIARGRETQEDIERRIARAGAYAVSGDDVFEIRNDGEVDVGVARFAEALARIDGRLFGKRSGVETAWPRPGAYLIAYRDGDVLFVRTEKNDKLHLPGGGVEPGENHEAAMRREAMEEAGAVLKGAARHLCDASAYHDKSGRTNWHKINRYFVGDVTIAHAPSEPGHTALWRPPRSVWDQLDGHVKYALEMAGLA